MDLHPPVSVAPAPVFVPTPDETCLANERVRAAMRDDDFDGDEILDDDDDFLGEEDVYEDGDEDEDEDFTPYPKPPSENDLPELTDDQQAVVDAWGDRAQPLCDASDADGMLRHLVDFMEQHPGLLAYLYIHDEYMPKLGLALMRRQEWPRYVALLKRLREQFPAVYVFWYAAYDFDIIVDQIVSGQTQDIARYFSYFHQYPDDDPDGAKRIAELLAWTGLSDALRAFALPISEPLRNSPNVLDGTFAMHWLIMLQYIPYLEAGPDPKTAAQSAIATMDSIGLDPTAFSESTIQRLIECCRKPLGDFDYAACKKKKDVKQYYGDVMWSCTGFFHNTKRLDWLRSVFLSEQLFSYFSYGWCDKKPKKPFVFDEERLKGYVQDRCCDIFSVDPIAVAAFLEAVWHFADYLLANAQFDVPERDRIQNMCRNLAGKYRDMREPMNAVLRLMPEFPVMKPLPASVN